MVIRESAWPPGTPCWVDLAVNDLERAKIFYGTLFGWEILTGPPESGGYSMAMVEGRQVAGIGPKQDPSQPTAWTTYLAVASAAETADKIRSAGGAVHVEPFDVMDAGRMAIVADPAGAVFGLWESQAHTGVDIANVPGTLVWNETLNPDFEGTKKFYAEVFGYDYGDMSSGDLQYATIKVDGRDVAGIGGLPPGGPADAPASWTAYFGVTDTDDAVSTVVELGGEALQPPEDSPYGRMATVRDDQGATFTIVQVASDT